MVTKYKVINNFGIAKKNDIFEIEKENDVYGLLEYRREELYGIYRRMYIAPSYAEELRKGGNLAILEETSDDDVNTLKLKALQTFILNTRGKYDSNASKIESNEKLPACVKLESKTVHYNLMKLLNQIYKIINE